ncbi:response regulator transcription factor [Bacillus cereus]|uniref:response regulator transcription factor n=1 Tax=Bacillus cereus TaxID=1396 RepID=UPI001CC05D31|nr:LuxR C-terminal-related transcriptional regulator [Bacillus cereus]
MGKSLCDQEKKVAILIAHGYKDVEIAQKLFVSRRRVGVIISSIKLKCKISSRVQIGILAYHRGWLEFEEIMRNDDYAQKSALY